MLGFERIGAVSFSKGCYPGQEIIARAKHLGRVKRRPQRLLAESDDPAKVVALQCGYNNALQLHRAFKRGESMTPTEYRKHVRGQAR